MPLPDDDGMTSYAAYSLSVITQIKPSAHSRLRGDRCLAVSLDVASEGLIWRDAASVNAEMWGEPGRSAVSVDWLGRFAAWRMAR
jgi:hypothetical protein